MKKTKHKNRGAQKKRCSMADHTWLVNAHDINNSSSFISLWPPLRSNGQAVMSYSCDLFIYYFLRSNLQGQKTPAHRTCARMSECGVIV